MLLVRRAALAVRRLAPLSFASNQTGYVRACPSSKVQLQCPPAFASCRYFSVMEWVTCTKAKEWMELFSAVDGSISFGERVMNRMPGCEHLLQRVKEVRERMKTNGEESAVPRYMLQKSRDVVSVVNRLKGPVPPSASKEFHKHMNEFYVLLVLQCCLSNCKTSEIRVEKGIPIVSTNNQALLESLSIYFLGIPTMFKPIGQCLGGVDAAGAAILEQSNAFSGVSPECPLKNGMIDSIITAKEEWVRSNGLPGDQDMMKRLLTVRSPTAVASYEGILHFTAQKIRNEIEMSRGDADVSDGAQTAQGTQSALFSYDFEAAEFGCPKMNFKSQNGMAINGDRMVASFPDRVVCNELSGGQWTSWTWKPEQALDSSDLCGLSMDDSHAYYCVGNSVVQLDLLTRKAHPIMGKIDETGQGSGNFPPAKWLLNNPKATATVDSLLFIADAGNQRVLCWDMNKNTCRISFESRSPTLLAADGEGFCVYDSDRHKIFHVSTSTYAVDYEIGSGCEGSTQELPAQSTPLGRVQSMTIRTAGQGRQLVFVCEDDDHVHACALPSLSHSTQYSKAAGPLTAIAPCQNQQMSAGNSLVTFHNNGLQPTCDQSFHSYSGGPAWMVLSEPLPADLAEMSIRWPMKLPTCNIYVCLVADNLGQSPEKQIDAYTLISPRWAAQTCVSTISESHEHMMEVDVVGENKQLIRLQDMQLLSGWKILKHLCRLAMEYVTRQCQKEPQNQFGKGVAFVEKTYNELQVLLFPVTEKIAPVTQKIRKIAATFVTRHWQKGKNSSHRKNWVSRMNDLNKYVTSRWGKEPKNSNFHYRAVNNFEVNVTREYQESADCLTWSAVNLKVNGKTRAGVLKPLTVGVDVPVRICMTTEEGNHFELMSPPKICTKGSYTF